MPRIILLVLLHAYAAWAVCAVPYHRPAGIADEKEPLIVAGYRALFTCSAHFFAGRPLDDIKKVELVDVEGLGYPDPVIDERTRTVTATDSTGEIVRIAAFRDSMGCTVLPPHWQRGDIPRLPNVAFAPAPDVSSLPFPAGDAVTQSDVRLSGLHAELVEERDRVGAEVLAVVALRRLAVPGLCGPSQAGLLEAAAFGPERRLCGGGRRDQR